MKERNNTSHIFDRAWAVIAALAALLLLFCKMSGRLAWSWPGVALGYVGIMCALMFCCVLLANAVILACKLHRWNRTRRVVNGSGKTSSCWPTARCWTKRPAGTTCAGNLEKRT